MLVDRDVTATLEHAQPAAGDQARRLGEELRLYQWSALPTRISVGARIALPHAARSNASSASIVVAVAARSSPLGRRRAGASRARAAAASCRVRAGRCPSSSGQAPAGGRRGGCGRPPGAGGLALAATSGTRCSTARGDRRRRGGRRPLLGDAAAGEMPATSTGPALSERIASACSCASSAIDRPRGSPFLRLT